MSVTTRSRRVYHLASITLALLAAIASAMLVLQQLGGLQLPGCGPSSACAQLSASRWGAVLGWPVSYIGLAYFSAVFVALVASFAGNLPRGMRVVLAVGSIASIAFLFIMASEQKWCGYCLTIHICNLGLLALTWLASKPQPQLIATRWRTPVITAVTVSLGLAIASSTVTRRVNQQQLAQTKDSIQQILANEQAAATTDENPGTMSSGFTGRRPRGADPSPARLVVFHDYQCKDCAKLDAEIELLMKQYLGLSVSMRHYPMCSKCNPHISWDFFHQEACRDAYLAEAAESLGGADGFWRMHQWLFSKLGSFSEDDLRGICNDNGWNYAELDKMAQSESVKHVVESDIAEAHSLGATGTPFVFLNGVEVRGASSNPGNVRLAVEKLLASNPVPKPIGWDRHPPSATERLLAEWKTSEPVAMPPRDAARLVFGAEDSPNRVLVFLEPTDRDALPLWMNIEQLIRDQADARIELYLFPISRKLNPKFASSASEMYPRSTEVTQLIEALHSVVDLKALPAAITWCLEASQTATGEELLDQTAKKLGISKQSVRTAIEDERVEAGIRSDLQQAGNSKVSWAPTLVVQGRKAPTPRVSYDLVRQMLQSEPASP